MCSCNQFPLLLLVFEHSGNDYEKERTSWGSLWNHLVIHVQLADFLPIDSNQGKNAAALPYKYHCVNIIKISLENANSQSLKLMNESKE